MKRTNSQVNAGNSYEARLPHTKNIRTVALPPHVTLFIEDTNTLLQNNTNNEVHTYSTDDNVYKLIGVIPIEPIDLFGNPIT